MNDRSRPAKAAPEVTATDIIEALASDTPRQLRRRREASRRLPELACGRRDPLDKPRKKPTVTVRLIGSRLSTAEWHGPGVLAAFKTLGITRYQRATFGGGLWCPAKHVDEVMAVLEARNYTILPTL